MPYTTRYFGCVVLQPVHWWAVRMAFAENLQVAARPATSAHQELDGSAGPVAGRLHRQVGERRAEARAFAQRIHMRADRSALLGGQVLPRDRVHNTVRAPSVRV